MAQAETARMPAVRPEEGKPQAVDGKKRESLFGDLTFAQVAAGALAAVTSMFLASSVGIAGSLIGAAVGSVVATVSSQIYRRFLNASADKLHGASSRHGSEDAAPGTAADGASGEASGFGVSASETVALPAIPRIAVSNTPRLDDFSANASVAVIDARQQRLRKARLQRRVVACSVVSALVAVVLSAATIGILTAGEGIGTKPPVPDASAWRQAQSAPQGAAADGSGSSGDAADTQQAPDAQSPGQGADADASDQHGEAGAGGLGQDSSSAPDSSGNSDAEQGQGSDSQDATEQKPSGQGDAGAGDSASSGSGGQGGDSSVIGTTEQTSR